MMTEVNGVEHLAVSSEVAGTTDCCHGEPNASVQEDMTAKDYYFDSYAHFGIHEVSVLTSMLSGTCFKLSDCNSQGMILLLCTDIMYFLFVCVFFVSFSI